MEFGLRLIEARRVKGLSQEALAEAVGVSRQAVSKWETGESKPDLSNLIALCNTLDLNIEYLCLGNNTCEIQNLKSTKKQPHRWTKILLCAAVILVSVIVGVVIGSLCTSVQENDHMNKLMLSMDIADIRVKSATAQFNLDTRRFEIRVLPDIVHEDIEVTLCLENRLFPSMPRINLDCTFEDGAYKCIFKDPKEGSDYRVIAVIKYKEMYTKAYVMDLVLHDDSCEWIPYWNQTS